MFEVRPGRRPARPGPVGDRLPVHRRAEGAREGVHRADGADGHLVQAARDGHAQRVELGARVRELRLQQPHADAAHPGGRPDRGPHRRRLMQPVPRRDRRARRRASTGSRTASTPGDPTTELNLHELTEDRAQGARRGAAARATCWTPPASSSRTTCCARRSGKTAREDYVDYYVKTKQDEFAEWHNEVTPWEINRYLQLF